MGGIFRSFHRNYKNLVEKSENLSTYLLPEI